MKRTWLIASLVIPVSCVSACGAGASTVSAHLSARLSPGHLGALEFKRESGAEKNFKLAGEQSLLEDGRVFSLRHDDIVEGSFQLGLFKPDVQATDPRVLSGIERTIAEGTFDPRRVHGQRIYEMKLTDQTIYLWFPPKMNVECLLVVRKRFRASDTLMRAIIEYQQGRVPLPVPIPSPDIVTAASPAPQAAAATPTPAAAPSGSPSR